MFADLLLAICTCLEALNKNEKLENFVFLTLAVIFFAD
jgi:hypothetical protein